MFMRTSTHDTVVSELNEGHRIEVAALNARIASLKEGNRIIREERNLAAAERDEARAELQPFLDRREKAKKNLRQFKKAPDVGADAQKVRA